MADHNMTPPLAGGARPDELAPLLLDWYDRHRRDLPWRAPPGRRAEPYRVWLSEIMLQQTTVPVAGPYFRAFVARWPTVEDLARAEPDEVLRAWAGLGYYARARNLLACARIVAGEMGGRFPEEEEALRRLPGVGPYTAAAVAAIAFDRPATAVDGNVERVVARLFATRDPLPAAKPLLRARAAELTSGRRPGDHVQALMDLGATVCVPRRPRCAVCPWATACVARAEGIAETLPRKAARTEKPVRRGVAFWLGNPAGAVLLRRRPDKGLLGGMLGFPTTAWGTAMPPLAEALRHAPLAADWRPAAGVVRHTFSHFHLELTVAVARIGDGWEAAEGIWVPVDRLGEQALPTAMRKVARHVLTGGGTE